MKRIALIIAGGSGERFWPLSRPNRPKQLLSLTRSGRIMLEETIRRIEPLFRMENIFVVTSRLLSDPIREQLPSIASQVFAEPDQRSSSGAIIWGMGLIAGLLGTRELSFSILPSDHSVEPARLFRTTVSHAIELSETSDRLVTIGIPPTRPETGYGYIECGGAIEESCFEVSRFVEKPSYTVAEELLKQPGMLWNSGMFFWRYATLLKELKMHAPFIAEALGQICEEVGQGSTLAADKAFRRIPTISIDHALMEHSRATAVVRGDFKWDDLGAWDSLSRVLPQDRAGNVVVGSARILESNSCVVHNSTADQTVSVLGMDDVIVVATDDAILVCPKNRAQEVRRLAAKLNLGGQGRAEGLDS